MEIYMWSFQIIKYNLNIWSFHLRNIYTIIECDAIKPSIRWSLDFMNPVRF